MRIEFEEKRENKIEKGVLLEVNGEVQGVVMNITETSSGEYGRIFDIKDFTVVYFVIVSAEILIFERDPIFPKNCHDISQKTGYAEYEKLEEQYNLYLQSDEFEAIPMSKYKLVVEE